MNKYILSSLILLSLDFVYLNLSKNHFSKVVRSIQGSDIKLNYIAAIACYICLILGINYFIIKDNRSILDAFLLGFFVYIVFDLTNKAIFNNWDYTTVIMDSLWGGTLFALTTYFVEKLI